MTRHNTNRVRLKPLLSFDPHPRTYLPGAGETSGHKSTAYGITGILSARQPPEGPPANSLNSPVTRADLFALRVDPDESGHFDNYRRWSHETVWSVHSTSPLTMKSTATTLNNIGLDTSHLNTAMRSLSKALVTNFGIRSADVYESEL